MKHLRSVAILFAGTLALVAGFQLFAQTPSSSVVLDWMYSNGLTKYNQLEDFRPFDDITRGEAAKFVDQYATLQNLSKNHTACDFSDISGYDSTLTPHIKQACFYGLLKGSQGTYRPRANILEAEALAVVMRSVYGHDTFSETGNPRWTAYYNRANELGLITNESLSSVGITNISREKLGTWFYQAAQLETDGGFYSTKIDKAQYKKYSAQEFDQAINDGKQVAFFFHAIRCPICHGTRDLINENIDDLPKDVVIFEITYDDSTLDIQEVYEVTAQTSFVFFDRSGNRTETSRNIYPDVMAELNKRFK